MKNLTMCSKFLFIFLFKFNIFINSVIYGSEEGSVVCRGPNGEPVDWFYMYKHPAKYAANDEPIIDSTYNEKYLYMTSIQSNIEWKLSDGNINETDSLVARTLIPILSDNNKLLLAYNDETPSGNVHEGYGHTKGVLSADNQTGFWLIHSVPKFPRIDEYEYPPSREYGQSFLCITLNSTQMDLVGIQQIYNEPIVYFARIPDTLKAIYPNLVMTSKMKWLKKPPYWNIADIISLNGTKFRVFAKGPKFHMELYEDLVAPTFGTNLFVQSWRNGPGPLPTNCTKQFHVMNIKKIKWPELNEEYKTTRDHSKWAVSDEYDGNWICVGDINRMRHQSRRGGGTVCQDNKAVARTFRDGIVKVEPCPA